MAGQAGSRTGGAACSFTDAIDRDVLDQQASDPLTLSRWRGRVAPQRVHG
jgi:hypothetical protein